MRWKRSAARLVLAKGLSSLPQLRSVDWIVKQNLIPDNARNITFLLNCAPNRDGLMDDNVVARMAEVGKAWASPPPLVHVPESWKNWPVPASVYRFSGKNIAAGKSTRIAPTQKAMNADALVDGNPETWVDLAATDAWVEIDLGKSYKLAGVHLWNRSPAHNVILEQGFIFVSETPFASADAAVLQRQAGVRSVAITEPPGYPAAFAIGVSGRYVRVVSTSGRPCALGEIEILVA